MGLVEQAEMVKKLTESKMESTSIMFGISTLSRETRNQLCRDIDMLVKSRGLSFESAFPHIRNDLKLIAITNRIDLAKLCWMYLRWLNEH